MPDLDLAALEALLAKVPPAPWTDTALPPDADGPAKGWSPSVLIAATSAGSGNKVFAVPSGGVSPPAVQRAIIALRNAAPALLAAARERDALMDALRLTAIESGFVVIDAKRDMWLQHESGNYDGEGEPYDGWRVRVYGRALPEVFEDFDQAYQAARKAVEEDHDDR